MRTSKSRLAIVILGLVLASVTAFGAPQSLTAYWFEWAPATMLEELSKDFTKETGIGFKISVTAVENWVQKINVEMAAHSDAYDIVIADSQDVGGMVTSGHFVDLTNWVRKNKVDKTFTAASMTAYAEYPKGSGKFWGVPTEGDAVGWAYRKDLFEDSKNKAAFKAKYGYDLGIPRDQQALLDIAAFFNNPSKNMYGIAIYGDNGYDSLAMFAEGAIWSYGGALGDYSNYKVDGILNSQGSVDGIEFYKKLWKFVPPGHGDAFFVKNNDAFTAGIVPMTCNFFAFFPALSNPATNPFAKATGYFANPPQKGRDGKVRQSAILGGMASSIVSYSKKQDAAYKWLEWFIRPDVQMKWAKMGGYSCHADTIASSTFINATPYNKAFKESMNIMRDWWACPEYADLLETFSKTVGNYIIRDQGTAKDALDKVTQKWTDIFTEAGYYKN
jgi:multiple sugar transport system substrate-binding protein